jgi:hypothetical protein
MCTSYKACQSFTTLTYEIGCTGSIPLANSLIKGTCFKKHWLLYDVWSNKVDKYHGITSNQMYQSIQCDYH